MYLSHILFVAVLCGIVSGMKQSNYKIVYRVHTHRRYIMHNGSCYKYKRNSQPLCQLDYEIDIGSDDKSIRSHKLKVPSKMFGKQKLTIIKGSMRTHSIPAKIWVKIKGTGQLHNTTQTQSFKAVLFKTIRLRFFRFPRVKRIHLMKQKKDIIRIGLTMTYTCADKYLGNECTEYCDKSLSKSSCKELDHIRCNRNCGKHGVCRYASYYVKKQICKCDDGFSGDNCEYLSTQSAQTTQLPLTSRTILDLTRKRLFKVEPTKNSKAPHFTQEIQRSTFPITQYQTETLRSSILTDSTSSYHHTTHISTTIDSTEALRTTHFPNDNPTEEEYIKHQTAFISTNVSKNTQNQQISDLVTVTSAQPIKKSNSNIKTATEIRMAQPIILKSRKKTKPFFNEYRKWIKMYKSNTKTTTAPIYRFTIYKTKLVQSTDKKKKTTIKKDNKMGWKINNHKYNIQVTRGIKDNKKLKTEEFWASNFRFISILLFTLVCLMLLLLVCITHKWYKLTLRTCRSTNNYYFVISNNNRVNKINEELHELSGLTKLIEEMQEKFQKPNMDLKTTFI